MVFQLAFSARDTPHRWICECVKASRCTVLVHWNLATGNPAQQQWPSAHLWTRKIIYERLKDFYGLDSRSFGFQGHLRNFLKYCTDMFSGENPTCFPNHFQFPQRYTRYVQVSLRIQRFGLVLAPLALAPAWRSTCLRAEGEPKNAGWTWLKGGIKWWKKWEMADGQTPRDPSWASKCVDWLVTYEYLWHLWHVTLPHWGFLDTWKPDLAMHMGSRPAPRPGMILLGTCLRWGCRQQPIANCLDVPGMQPSLCPDVQCGRYYLFLLLIAVPLMNVRLLVAQVEVFALNDW